MQPTFVYTGGMISEFAGASDSQIMSDIWQDEAPLAAAQVVVNFPAGHATHSWPLVLSDV